MDLALLVLRLVVGLFFVGHGAQKLWGSFGGHGPHGTAQFFESLGLKPGMRNALAAGWSEFLGGALLALGLLSPLGALLIIATMTTAILTVHAKNGPWVTDSGYEYNAVLIASCFVIAANPGSWALDGAFGLDEIHGTAFAVGALVFGVIGGMLALTMGRRGSATGTPQAATPGDADARFERTGDTAAQPAAGAHAGSDIPADPR
jgi:putative oxidoreductase